MAQLSLELDALSTQTTQKETPAIDTAAIAAAGDRRNTTTEPDQRRSAAYDDLGGHAPQVHTVDHRHGRLAL